MIFRQIEKKDDAALAELIRKTLEANDLDIPGTAYFDDTLDHLSDYYLSEPDKRRYIVICDEDGRAAGGVGIAEFDGMAECAELQKLYLDDRFKGKGLGRALVETAEREAVSLGYKRIYLETHDSLRAAVCLYEKLGYNDTKNTGSCVHNAMNRFFLKELAIA